MTSLYGEKPKGVNLDIALQRRKILTQLEFDSTFPNENYSQYCRNYYKMQFRRFFDKYLHYKWFIERFQTVTNKKQHILDKYEEFKLLHESDFPVLSIDQEIKTRMNKLDGQYIVLERIPAYCGMNDINELFSMVDGIKNHTITQMSNHNPSNTRVFAAVNTNNMDKLLNDIQEKAPMTIKPATFCIDQKIKLNTIWLKQRESDLTNLKNIFSMLNQQYRTNITFEPKSIDHFIIFLRMVFNYCYYCTKMYESEIEMYFDCGDFHIRGNMVQSTVFDRKQKILTAPKDLSFLIEQNIDNELEYHIFKGPGSAVTCSKCKNSFESVVSTLQHMKIHHGGFISELQMNLDSFKKFVKNADINLLIFLDGIDDNLLPSFAVHESESYAVKYDLPMIYSGKAAR